ncbi:MAG: phage tail protein [Anaerolineae bacterium]
MDTPRTLRRLPLRAQEIKEPSRLLNYLPGFYADDPFLNGFLWIFQSIWDPLDRQLDQLYAYFDPRLAPEDMIPWLGTWVDLVLDENWQPERRRLLIQRAADLYRRRGTAGALRDYLEIFTGVRPLIVDQSDDPVPFHFMVVFSADQPEAIDEERVRRIIEGEKPAHTTYTLYIETRDGPHSRLGSDALGAARST